MLDSLGYAATAGADFMIETQFITFTAGQYRFDGIEQCSTIDILDDNVRIYVNYYGAYLYHFTKLMHILCRERSYAYKVFLYSMFL